MSAIPAENPRREVQPARDRLAVYSGLSIGLTPAPLIKRALAYVVDGAILTGCLYALFFLVTIAGTITAFGLAVVFRVNHLATKNLAHEILIAIYVVTAIAALLAIDGYFIYFEYRKGTTPGKRIFGLRVVPLGRARLSLGQCVRRELFRYVDCVLIVPGLLSVCLSRQRQRIGDLAAGTLVTHSPRSERKRDFLYIRAEDYLWLAESLEPRPIPAELRERFLRFAYPYFVLRQAQASPAELASWESSLRPFIRDPSSLQLNQVSLLRFLAEYCFQTASHQATEGS